MKRLFSALMLLPLFLFSSCSQLFAPSPPERVREFSADVNIVFAEKSFSGTLSCMTSADIKLLFTAPEELRGFSVKTSPEGFVCDVHGITDLIPPGTLPENACAELFFEAIESAVFEPVEMRMNADGDYYADIKNGKYTAFYSSEGTLKKISSPAYGFTIGFGESSTQK